VALRAVLSRRIFWALLVGVCALLPYLGFLSINNHVLWYDDEGYLMISLQGVLDGKQLYSEIYSQYGPFYYQIYSLVFSVLPGSLTHDSNRMVSLAAWILSSGLFGVLVHRLSRNQVASALAAIGAFLFLESMVKEPGHPQQLCFIVLITALVAAAGGASRFALGALGAATAALTLCKVNLGALFFVACAIACAPMVAAGRLKVILSTVGVIGIMLLGAIPIAAQLNGASVAIAVTLAVSAISVVVTLSKSSIRDAVLAGQVACFVAGALGVGLFSLGLFFATGGRLDDLLWATVFQHSALAGGSSFSYPLFSALLAIVGLASAMWLHRIPRAKMRRFLLAGKLVFALGVLLAVVAGLFMDSVAGLDSGAAVRGNAALLWQVAPGFAWLSVVPLADNSPRCSPFGRALLAAVSVTSIQIAFPVPGTQTSFASVLFIAVAVLCLLDVLDESVEAEPIVRFVARACSLGLVVGVLTVAPLRTAFAHLAYHRGGWDPGLPGASNLRLTKQESQVLSGLVRGISEQCDAFVSIPGFNSLHFWTGIKPVTGWNMTVWPYHLTVRQQQDMITALDAHPRPCVIYSRAYDYFRSGHLATERGLFGRHVLATYHPSWAVGPYVVFKKNVAGSVAPPPR
jgi:hypothetical protein